MKLTLCVLLFCAVGALCGCARPTFKKPYWDDDFGWVCRQSLSITSSEYHLSYDDANHTVTCVLEPSDPYFMGRHERDYKAVTP